MSELAHALSERFAAADVELREQWAPVEARLNEEQHLEAALDEVPADSPLIPGIVAIAAEVIETAEQEAFRALIGGKRFALSELIPDLVFGGRCDIVTTNYDRLIELATELAGFFLDTGFVGGHFGRCDAALSHEVLRSGILKRPKSYLMRYRTHVRLSKPHGSLDWYLRDHVPIRSPYRLDLQRLMITPGGNKFRRGYDRPFDEHREVANRAIDAAARFLTIGYGFNDEHLQTHLEPRIRIGAPCLIVTRTLTPAAKTLLEEAPAVMALESDGAGGTRIHDGQVVSVVDGAELWQLDNFIDEVLR